MKVEIKNDLNSVKNVMEEKFAAVEGRVNVIERKVEDLEEKFRKTRSGDGAEVLEKVEEKLEKVEGKVEEKLEKVEGKFEKVEETFSRRFEDLEKKLALTTSSPDAFKFLPATSRPSVKLSTYDGKSSWQVYKTQFAIVADANGWDSATKACQLAASLRSDAADVLQTLPGGSETLNFENLSSALEMRFGEKCLKDYSRLQLKSRQQKVGESLQELATDVERLSHLAFADCPTDVRETLSLQYFVDGVRDPEIQKALRMADVKDLKSALVYALKFEAAQQATRRDRHIVRAATVQDTNDSILTRIMKKIEALEKQFGSMRPGAASKKSIKCWNCGGEGHLRRHCQRLQEYDKEIRHRRGSSHGNANALSRKSCPATRRDRHIVRAATIQDTNDSTLTRIMEKIEALEKQFGSMRPEAASKKSIKCWNCGGEGHLRRHCQRQQKQVSENTSSSRKGKLEYGYLAGRRLPGIKEPHFKVLQITSMNGGDNGLFVLGLINEFSCRMVIDTGANVTIIREDVAQQIGEKFIWTPPCVTLQTVTGEKIKIHGKVNINIKFGSASYHHTAFVADITDPFILGLDFLKKHNFTLDFKNSELHSTSEDIALFEISDREIQATCAPVACINKKYNPNSAMSSATLKSDLLQSVELDKEESNAAGNLIAEFKDLFSCTSEDVGRTQLTQHRINTGNHPPTKQHPRRLHFAKQEEVGKLLKEMEESDVIEPSTSPWASPIVLDRERINVATEKMKTRYDAKATGHQFHVDDKVWLWNPLRRKGLSPKLQSHWDGPYTVLNRLNDVVVRIRKSPTSKPRVVHYDRLAPYYGHNP